MTANLIKSTPPAALLRTGALRKHRKNLHPSILNSVIYLNLGPHAELLRCI